VIGLVVFYGAKQSWSQGASLFVVTGVLGGFTTFSAFSLENLQLVQDGKVGLALVYGFGSPVIGLALAYCGFLLAQKLIV
jgi:CrcB protein